MLLQCLTDAPDRTVPSRRRSALSASRACRFPAPGRCWRWRERCFWSPFSLSSARRNDRGCGRNRIGERRQAIGMGAGDTPRDPPTPVVTRREEAPCPRSRQPPRSSIRIADQLLESVVGKIGRIGPRAGEGKPMLVRRDGAIAARRQLAGRVARQLRKVIWETRAASARAVRRPGPRSTSVVNVRPGPGLEVYRPRP